VTFALSDRNVFATSTTTFKGGSCRDLRDSAEVTVKGMLMSDDTVRAIEIRRK